MATVLYVLYLLLLLMCLTLFNYIIQCGGAGVSEDKFPLNCYDFNGQSSLLNWIELKTSVAVLPRACRSDSK